MEGPIEEALFEHRAYEDLITYLKFNRIYLPAKSIAPQRESTAENAFSLSNCGTHAIEIASPNDAIALKILQNRVRSLGFMLDASHEKIEDDNVLLSNKKRMGRAERRPF
jgi:hypothetical protein